MDIGTTSKTTYCYPSLDLLKKYDNISSSTVDLTEYETNKKRIVEVLRCYGIGTSSITATIGPAVTVFEIKPAIGFKLSKIFNHEEDIVFMLSDLHIKRIDTIMDKGTIAIEAANAKPNIVSMESVLNSKEFQENTMELPCAIGKTVYNEVFMFDLSKMPHLLVAGSTGQGKSVILKAIITSLLYKKHPAEMKLVLIDPKDVEFSIYKPIANHFLAMVQETNGNADPIVTDNTKAVRVLNSLCKEMDMRFDLLRLAEVRNLKDYNHKFNAGELKHEDGHRYMPYIVVVIDEFGDLIMTAGKEIEKPILRIAQMAQACGIHIVMATQCLTMNVITGTIKANFSRRIAYRVATESDSMTILDRPGANLLTGKGDMLFLGDNEPVRVQGALVEDSEIDSICEYISKQQCFASPYVLLEPEGDNIQRNKQ